MKNIYYSKELYISLLILGFLLLVSNWSIGQCTNVTSYGSAVAPTSGSASISGCNYQTEYSTITSVVSGTTYQATNSSGGCITVHSGTPGGPVVASGNAPLTWTATSNGTYYLHYNTNCVSCGTATSCGTTALNYVSGGGGGGGAPCASIMNIGGCGQSINVTMSGTGAWNTATCGFSTPGVESMFSYTATSTGVYSIDVTSATGGYVDFLWKLASGGCNNTGWNCIDDVFTPGNYGAMSWTAGVTYYILLDPETTGAVDFTFDLSCPAGGPVTAADCSTAYSICTDVNFQIDPNGYGAIDQ